VNAITAIPGMVVLVVFVAPFTLDGGKGYVTWVSHEWPLVVVAMACWWQSLYWLTRRAAEILLLRGSGAKLRAVNGSR
jgi:hypothetical protein